MVATEAGSVHHTEMHYYFTKVRKPKYANNNSRKKNSSRMRITNCMCISSHWITGSHSEQVWTRRYPCLPDVTSIVHGRSHWRIYWVQGVLPRPRAPIFFRFHAVFGKIWLTCMLTPSPWGVGARLGKSWIRHWVWYNNLESTPLKPPVRGGHELL